MIKNNTQKEYHTVFLHVYHSKKEIHMHKKKFPGRSNLQDENRLSWHAHARTLITEMFDIFVYLILIKSRDTKNM